MCGYMPIIDVYAREILDSAGNPAIEVEIMTEDGTVGRAAVPSDVSGDGCVALPPGVSDDGNGAGLSGVSDDGNEAELPGVSDDGNVAVPSMNVCAESVGASEICQLVNSALADVVIGENVFEQASIDRLLRQKSRDSGSLTRNALRCVSKAVAKTASKSLCLPLYRYLGGICADRVPTPMVTLLYGIRCKEKPCIERTIRSDVREFMIMSTGACTYEKGLRMCMEVCRVFWQMYTERQFFAEDGVLLSAEKEAGFTANQTFAGKRILAEGNGRSVLNPVSTDAPVTVGTRMDTESVLSLILKAVKEAGYQPGREIALAIDMAADELYEEASGAYVFWCERKPDEGESRRSAEKMPDESGIGRRTEKHSDEGESRKRTEKMSDSGESRKSTEDMIDWLERLCGSFPVLSIVDGLSQRDREGWQKLTRRLGGRVRLVADRLFDADPKSFLDTRCEQTANAVLIKPDRFDTLTDLLHTATLAKDNGYDVVFSYGERETWDSLIADLAVAVGGTQIRGGVPCRAEATAKYNRLLRIEDSLGLAAWSQDFV